LKSRFFVALFFIGIREIYPDSFRQLLVLYFLAVHLAGMEMGGKIRILEAGNPMLAFLEKLTDSEAIHNNIDRLTSRIVIKFDPESESLGDFFWDYLTD
jgi:hypothetical protein